MMPLILPTTTSGRSLWAAAVLTANTSAPARLTSSSARTARINPLRRRHRRQLASDGLDLGPQPRNGCLVGRTLSDRADDLRDALHLGLRSAARRHRRRAEPDAAGDGRPARL